MMAEGLSIGRQQLVLLRSWAHCLLLLIARHVNVFFFFSLYSWQRKQIFYLFINFFSELVLTNVDERAKIHY